MRFGLNGKGMGWNMVHDSPSVLLPSTIKPPTTSQRNPPRHLTTTDTDIDLDFASVLLFDLDFVSVKFWLRLRVSQMPDIDSASVQSRSSRMLPSRSLELCCPY